MDKFDDIVQVHCEPSCPPLISHDCHVKGRLRDGLKFWSEIGTHDMIKSVLANGYFIPFVQIPPPMFFSNNTSALRHHEFVTESVVELLSSGRIQETPLPSYIVSPLSVSRQSETKKRLILDLSVLNKFVRTQHFKLDEWKTGLQYISPNALLFAFDLKSGYHHIEIAPQHQKYLGFSWVIDNAQRFFEFTVLPFGLSSAPYIFTKVLKPLVSHWRSCGIHVAVYLDDGFVVVPREQSSEYEHFDRARRVSDHVRSDLLRAGFIYNIEKSSWSPQPSLVWLGMAWDASNGTLKITNKRITKLIRYINQLLQLPSCYIRDLQSFVGQIISLSPVVGNLARFMTRSCQITIASAQNENLHISLEDKCIEELTFWRDNVMHLNSRYIFASPKVHTIMCSDASAVASGAIISVGNHIAHKNWSPSEKTQSSTWRELETMRFAINSFIPLLQNSRVKLFTDSQSAAHIIEVGSMKHELHSIAIKIFHLCLTHRISLEVQWIPRSLNDQADYISKWVDTEDWSITDTFFNAINDITDPLTVDCFACYYNTKLPRFFSRYWNPGAEAIDAFAQDWSGENALLVPPVTLIQAALNHLYFCHGRGVLVFPWWPSSSFWPVLWSKYRPYIKQLFTMSGNMALKHGRNTNSLLGSPHFDGIVAAVILNVKIT